MNIVEMNLMGINGFPWWHTGGFDWSLLFHFLKIDAGKFVN